MHWVIAVIAWHRANVLGNVVASLEMGVVLLAAGRPLLRRLSNRLRHHLAAQVEEHMSPVHRRLDELWAHLLDVDDDTTDSDHENSQQ